MDVVLFARLIARVTVMCILCICLICCHFSPFILNCLAISLCRAVHYVCHTVLLVLRHIFCRLLFVLVSLYVIPPSFLFDLCSFSQRLFLFPAILHKCDCVLVRRQWRHHFNLRFFKEVSTGLMCTFFLDF